MALDTNCSRIRTIGALWPQVVRFAKVEAGRHQMRARIRRNVHFRSFQPVFVFLTVSASWPIAEQLAL